MTPSRDAKKIAVDHMSRESTAGHNFSTDPIITLLVHVRDLRPYIGRHLR